MIADLILQLLGRDPAAYTGTDDKWITISATLFIYSFPIVLFLLFISPFIFLWLKKKRFSLRNIILSILAGAVLAAVGVGLYYFIFILIAGIGVRQLYCGGLLC